jgi:hypothetical protein
MRGVSLMQGRGANVLRPSFAVLLSRLIDWALSETIFSSLASLTLAEPSELSTAIGAFAFPAGAGLSEGRAVSGMHLYLG